MRRFSLPAVSLGILVVLAGAVPAGASHYRGVRATIVSQNPVTFDVTINLTVYTDGAGSGSITAGSFYDGTQSVNHFPAIDWGDGVTLSSTSVPFVANTGPSGTALYRGSFSHTYPDATQRTITVAAGCCAGTGGGGAGTVGSPGNTPVAGNPIYSTDSPQYMNGFSNTVQAFAAVPAVRRTGLGLLAVGLALAGTLLLWRRRTQVQRG